MTSNIHQLHIIKKPLQLPLVAITQVDRLVRRWLDHPDPFLKRLLKFSAISRGKRLRAHVTLLAAQACGRVNPKVVRLATAYELFHYATLMHDDVLDHARERRHRPTLNHHYGNEVAVLVGDFLFTQVMRIVFENLPAALQGIVVRAAGQVCLGEILEHRFRGDLGLSRPAYLKVISHKTASLFAACGLGGARLAGGTKNQSDGLWEYGQNFGLAFQIRDDILDLVGKVRRTGKPVGTDLKEGRITLPVILGLRGLPTRERGKFRQAVRSGKNIAFIQDTLVRQGFVARAQSEAVKYAQRAENALAAFPDSRAKQQLISLARFAVERDR